jgi:hypothetical protein
MPDIDDLRILPQIARFAHALRVRAPNKLRAARDIGKRSTKEARAASRLRSYPR